MIPSSTSLPRLLKSIREYDDSIRYEPILFIGFIRDLYVGKKDVLDDFFFLLHELRIQIHNRSINSYDLSHINLNGVNRLKRESVQSELLKYVYLNRNSTNLNIGKLDELIHDVYGNLTKFKTKSYNNNKNSSIVFFKSSSLGLIEYGKILTLSWECNNPYRVLLFDGYDYMNVTHISSIQVSIMFDKYELQLYDKKDKIVDKKEISISFRKNAYCMNCGHLICKDGDKYCIHCGFKLYYDTEN